MKRLFGFFLFAGLTGCSPSLDFTVRNVQDAAFFGKNCTIYALPRTRLIIKVIAIRHQIIPGPYYQFASRFLDLEGVYSSSTIKWEIIGTEISTLNEPDQEYFFMIDSKKIADVSTSISKIKDEGLVLNPDDFPTFVNNPQVVNKKQIAVPFNNILIEDYTGKSEEKAENKLTKDAFPVGLNLASEPNNADILEERAEDAADLLVDIRKRRFDLISGKAATYPKELRLKLALKN